MSSSSDVFQSLSSTDYTADPSAHSFNNRLYVYPSHDRDTGIEDNDNGDQYDMADYHVYSMDDISGPVTDHGVALKGSDVKWVSKQVWAPDACTKNGKYFFYFPARDKEGIFRIGVAESDKPEGPFKPDDDYIPGSYSIDPASFVDDDGEAYLYFGGLWGGQLQCWEEHGKFDPSKGGPQEPTGDRPALCARVAKLSENMHTFAEVDKPVQILDEAGEPIKADDHARRFFEAAWMHKYRGKYYFSYSTGDTHFLAYAIGDSPYGPFTYAGKMLDPVQGWTTHHSVVEHRGRWWLFHHDTRDSGKNHLRSVKVVEIFYDKDGKIVLDKEKSGK